MGGKTLGIKIPASLKTMYDNLSPAQKKRATERMVHELKRSIHDFRFDPDAAEWRDDDGEIE